MPYVEPGTIRGHASSVVWSAAEHARPHKLEGGGTLAPACAGVPDR